MKKEDFRSDKPDRARVFVPPPLVFLPAIVVGSLLTPRFAIPMLVGPDTTRLVGLILAVLAVGLVVVAARRLILSGQEPAPWKPSPVLITDGVYAISRNPIYLGFAIGQVALGFLARNAWFIVLCPLSLALAWVLAIRAEQAYLERRFGEAFNEYRRRVRCWL